MAVCGLSGQCLQHKSMPGRDRVGVGAGGKPRAWPGKAEEPPGELLLTEEPPGFSRRKLDLVRLLFPEDSYVGKVADPWRPFGSGGGGIAAGTLRRVGFFFIGM